MHPHSIAALSALLVYLFFGACDPAWVFHFSVLYRSASRAAAGEAWSANAWISLRNAVEYAAAAEADSRGSGLSSLSFLSGCAAVLRTALWPVDLALYAAFSRRSGA